MLLALAPILLASCSGEEGRELARYYDPQGLFRVDLPAADVLTVTPPRSGDGGPALLTGVVAQPPAPSPAPQAGLGALDFARAEEQDRTIYQALAVTTEGFEDLSEMGLFFLTGDPGIDVQLDEPVRIDGHEGRLVVADVENAGQVTATVAVALTLGQDGTGYLLAAVFPAGRWGSERPDFLRVLGSFRADVPPGLGTFPVTGQAT
jgi:hypothetical protein